MRFLRIIASVYLLALGSCGNPDEGINNLCLQCGGGNNGTGAKVKYEGQVNDAETAQALSGVTVTVKETGASTITDPEGRFSIEVPTNSFVTTEFAVSDSLNSIITIVSEPIEIPSNAARVNVIWAIDMQEHIAVAVNIDMQLTEGAQDPLEDTFAEPVPKPSPEPSPTPQASTLEKLVVVVQDRGGSVVPYLYALGARIEFPVQEGAASSISYTINLEEVPATGELRFDALGAATEPISTNSLLQQVRDEAEQNGGTNIIELYFNANQDANRLTEVALTNITQKNLNGGVTHSAQDVHYAASPGDEEDEYAPGQDSENETTEDGEEKM